MCCYSASKARLYFNLIEIPYTCRFHFELTLIFLLSTDGDSKGSITLSFIFPDNFSSNNHRYKDRHKIQYYY